MFPKGESWLFLRSNEQSMRITILPYFLPHPTCPILALLSPEVPFSCNKWSENFMTTGDQISVPPEFPICLYFCLFLNIKPYAMTREHMPLSSMYYPSDRCYLLNTPHLVPSELKKHGCLNTDSRVEKFFVFLTGWLEGVLVGSKGIRELMLLFRSDPTLWVSVYFSRSGCTLVCK